MLFEVVIELSTGCRFRSCLVFSWC